MKSFFKKVKKFTSQINILIILVALILILFLAVLVVNNSSNSDSNKVDNNVQDVGQNRPSATLENFPESKELLRAFPYEGNGFSADLLPLESDASPTVIVQITNSTGRDEFLQWINTFEYDAFGINIQFIEENPLDLPYDGNL